MHDRTQKTTESDEALMQAYCDGNEQAFVELYGRYRDAIYRYVYRKIAHQGRAEELTQDVFIAVIQSRQTWRPTALFRTYLYRIANNRCISEMQRAERRIMVAPVADENGESVLPEVVAATESAFEAVEREELATALHGAIGQLSDDFRIPLMLELAEASREEIAARLAIPIETVKTRIFRAKSKLRAILAHGIGRDLALAGQ